MGARRREAARVAPAARRTGGAERKRAALLQALALDPRPAWQDDPERVYGFPFAGREVRFRVAGGVLTVLSADPAAAAADGAGGA